MTTRSRLPADPPVTFRARVGCAGLVLALVAYAEPGKAQAPGLEAILDRASVSPPARVAFVEERQNPLFDEPMTLTGHLEYLGAGSLRKVIETPFTDTFSIESGEIMLESAEDGRDLPAAVARSLETMLGAIESILAGDSERLESFFSHEISGNDAQWTIALTPRSRRIRRHLPELTVIGNADAVLRIVMDLRDGERHTMEILHDAPQP